MATEASKLLSQFCFLKCVSLLDCTEFSGSWPNCESHSQPCAFSHSHFRVHQPDTYPPVACPPQLQNLVGGLGALILEPQPPLSGSFHFLGLLPATPSPGSPPAFLIHQAHLSLLFPMLLEAPVGGVFPLTSDTCCCKHSLVALHFILCTSTFSQHCPLSCAFSHFFQNPCSVSGIVQGTEIWGVEAGKGGSLWAWIHL